MKLAEGLSIRADLQRKIAQLKERILRNAKVQIDEEPAEDPNELLKVLNDNAQELQNFIVRINKTNSSVSFDKNRTLTEALAERERLTMLISMYHELAKSATVTQERYKALEIKFKPAVNVKKIQKNADGLSKALRELDVQIQELNWTVELMD